MNVVLARKWGAVDCRWNQNAHVFAYPNWRKSPLDRETFARLRNSPWIVHYCSPSKPWQYFCRHPFARDFFGCLDHTDWKDWRPERPENFLQQWWDFHYRPLSKKWKSQVRTAKQFIRGKRRAA